MRSKAEQQLYISYKSRYIIRRQRASIKAAFQHIRNPNHPISNNDLINYSFHLSLIVELMVDPKIAHYGQRVLHLVIRYLDYRKVRNGKKTILRNHWEFNQVQHQLKWIRTERNSVMEKDPDQMGQGGL